MARALRRHHEHRVKEWWRRRLRRYRRSTTWEAHEEFVKKFAPKLANRNVCRGYTRPEDQQASFKAGFDHHLGKPISIPELKQLLAAMSGHPMSRRILIVDDDDALRANIRELLEDEGWEVREGRDGKEAVEAVGGFDPAVMLLDYRLPELDGGEVLRQLGAVHATPRVVLMTGSAQVRDIARQHGLRFYIPKPFRSDDLLDTVEHARSGS